MQFIDLQRQYQQYRTEINARIQRVLDHGQYILGPEVAEVESALAAYVGVKHCLSVASGTDSLEIALRAWSVGPGDEVITVPFTWISSAEVIGLVGAKPVFVDIRAADYNLDIDQLEAAITPRTKAIMPVSLFGQMPDFGRINAIAARHGVPVLEDAAQSFGAQQRGRRSCSVSRVGSTSFFPAKPLGCYGEGGALFTNDDALAERMKAIRTHGGVRRHEHSLLGMNGRFDTLQAAVLLAKLPYFDAELQARAQVARRYNELLAPILPALQPGNDSTSERFNATALPMVLPGNTHVYAQYTIRVPNRDRLGERLKAKGIPTGVYYPKCLHEQPVFAHCGYGPGAFPVAEQAAREVISLPMHPFLTEAEQDSIVQAVRESV